jgi:hypothetical protein
MPFRVRIDKSAGSAATESSTSISEHLRKAVRSAPAILIIPELGLVDVSTIDSSCIPALGLSEFLCARPIPSTKREITVEGQRGADHTLAVQGPKAQPESQIHEGWLAQAAS